MKEALFIRNNQERWRQTEAVADSARQQPPDVLADAYQDIIADLAFAQGHYPQSRITVYLNGLAVALHNEIYRYRRERSSRFVTFWTHEMPLALYDARRELLLATCIFVFSVLVGVVSTLGDADFPRLIMGDAYVDMTLDNIANGRPMDVYAGEDETTMFLGITLNNIMVSFTVFASGLLSSLLTGWLIFQNSVMIGAFETFFNQHGLLWQSALAVWLHGVLEISSILVAGAAGIVMGNGWLFPGTYARLTSFRRSARRGLKLVVGTVPIFIVAGFIEGFLTRHTEWSDGLRLTIIAASSAFVLFYYVWLPFRMGRRRARLSTL